jgi:hypothetical protein
LAQPGHTERRFKISGLTSISEWPLPGRPNNRLAWPRMAHKGHEETAAELNAGGLLWIGGPCSLVAGGTAGTVIKAVFNSLGRPARGRLKIRPHQRAPFNGDQLHRAFGVRSRRASGRSLPGHVGSESHLRVTPNAANPATIKATTAISKNDMGLASGGVDCSLDRTQRGEDGRDAGLTRALLPHRSAHRVFAAHARGVRRRQIA